MNLRKRLRAAEANLDRYEMELERCEAELLDLIINDASWARIQWKKKSVGVWKSKINTTRKIIMRLQMQIDD